MSAITVRPGETVTVIGLPAIDPGLRPTHPIALPGDPWWGSGGPPPGGGGPVDPGYSPPWAQVPTRPTHPIALPGDPWWGQDLRPTHPIVLPPPPVDPPPTNPPADNTGHWVWAWSPRLGRWVWVKVPGEGEAGPKTT